MKNIILRTNAIPIYGFLSVISDRQSQGESLRNKKILDCGAGGPVPPLALFHQHGFEGWGIDTSDEQLSKARRYCMEHEFELHLQKGDMRRIPFSANTFDFVYEHYSMCHLSKSDTVLAVSEMFRVLKRQGLCYLGVISMDSWPKSFFGKEKNPGEYWTDDHGDKSSVHSMFTNQEVEQLVSDWEILSMESRVIYNRDVASKMSLEEWMKLYDEAEDEYSIDQWQRKYMSRSNAIKYAQLYFILKKPS